MFQSFRRLIDIRREELPLSLLMFSYFFMVITSFWILKPIKKTLFIAFYQRSGFNIFSWHLEAAEAELIAKVLNMVVACLAVVAFSRLAERFRRQRLSILLTVFFLVCYVAYTLFINHPGDWTVWSFYLYGDLFSTLMVPAFYAFLNDSVTPDAAKRLYGLIGLGGVAGGVFGSSFVRLWIDELRTSSWLWVCFGIGLIIALVALAAGRLVDRNLASQPAQTLKEEPVPLAERRNPALEGAWLVMRSPYLLAIVAIVGLYEIVSTIMDFQFTSAVTHFLQGDAVGRQISTVFAITNIVSLVVQLFLTSLIMTRFGLTVALLVLPVAILAGSTGFLIAPVLLFGSSLNTADNGFSYSINQSAKEALYVPTSRNEKYKAKAFIDMFVQRFAKSLAVLLSLGMAAIFSDFSGIRWLSVVTLTLVLVWVYAARYAGKKFNELTQPTAAPASRALV